MTDESVPQAADGTAKPPGILASLTRRGFLGAAGIGAASVGVMSSTAGISLVSDSQEIDPGEVPAAAMAEPLVAQVRDFGTGEISIMSGLREVIVRDPQLVMRLLRSFHP
jgi:hypothetical protein